MCFFWFSENVGIPEAKSRNYISCNENLDSQLWIQIYFCIDFLVMIGESFAKRWTNDPSIQFWANALFDSTTSFKSNMEPAYSKGTNKKVSAVSFSGV